MNYYTNKSERISLSIIKKILSVIIGIILIIIQLIIYYFVLVEMIYIPGIAVVSFIASLIIISYIYNSNMNSSYKLTWTIVCLLFNVSGPISFLVFGNGANLPKKKNKKIMAYLEQKMVFNDCLDKLKIEDEIGYKHAKLLNTITKYPLYNNTPSTFYSDGELMYNCILDKIRNAKKYIFMEFFIVSEGSMFNELFDVLFKKANEGIEIKIIYDALGCRSILKNKVVKKINQSKIRMVPYNPFGTNLRLAYNYRDHRKIVVVDGIYAFTGGINLADEYIHRKLRYGYWRDNGCLIEGSATYTYTLLFAQNWYMSTKEMLLIEDYKSYSDKVDTGYVFPFGDGPTLRESPSYELFLSLIHNAKESIYISTPYFLIDSQFIAALTQAIKCGIDVKLLIPGVPDKKFVYNMTLAHLKHILDNGGEVYKFTNGFNHAKNIIVDNKYCFIGTTNLDYRSLFLNFECGNLLINNDCISDIQEDFLQAIANSQKINIEEWKKRSILTKFGSFILTILGPLL